MKRKDPQTKGTIDDKQWADLQRRAQNSPESPFSRRAVARRKATELQREKRKWS
ncbi:hypothetical protein ACFXJ8_11790 [Nonomuraea sp. NPDC059194]|uniref:hypothetical protein n=1 Tax=Nonomuraea sp. NPDC059194 TaxID=3346764 RepID=UPI0036801BDF